MQSSQETILIEVGKKIQLLLRGKIPEPIETSDLCGPLEKEFAEIINTLIDHFHDSYQFAHSLAGGNLDYPVPKQQNLFASPMKQLHAQLAHLTWQAERIAEGDYNQRVDFMGDFSEAINKMVVQLEEREKALKQSRDELEAKVQSRTIELSQVNAALIRDVAKRKKTEQNLREINQQLEAFIEHTNLLAEEAKKANKIKTEFLTNMSHELRTPLNSILGFSEYLCECDLEKEQHECIRIILKNSRLLLQLIDDVFDFSKADSGCISLDYKSHEICNIVAFIEDLTQKLAAKKKIELQINIAESLVEKIFVDINSLERCLIHIIDNAIKFTHQGFVRVRLFHDPPENQDWICFQVEDSGIGIESEKLDTIFDPFTQVDGSSTRLYGGTGLGLTITKQLVEIMGGDITLSTNEDQGTSVLIRLPVNGNHI